MSIEHTLDCLARMHAKLEKNPNGHMTVQQTPSDTVVFKAYDNDGQLIDMVVVTKDNPLWADVVNHWISNPKGASSEH